MNEKRTMMKWSIIWLFLGIVSNVKAQPEEAYHKLMSVHELQHAAISISVKRVSDGSQYTAYQPEMALTPASVLKLIPTFLALEEKGADYRYETKVFRTGTLRGGILTGDLVVVPGGDPAWESKYFPNHRLIRTITDYLKKTGVRIIKGQVRIEKTDTTQIPGSWLWEDVSNYYAALYFPFNYRDNRYALEFKTGASGTPAVLVSVEPAQPQITFRNEVKASSQGGDNAWIYGGPYSRELYVRGTLPASKPSYKIYGAMTHPATCFKAELEEAIRKRGIQVDPAENKEESRMLILTLPSPSLKELVTVTNKNSVNLFAEALGQLVSAEDFPGQAKQLLTAEGIDASGMILKDACGLSPMNAVSAGLITDLLVNAARNTTFVRSLPVGGTDASLNPYVQAVPGLRSRLKAKTGSMDGVRGLAGYLTDSKGENYAFTILVNHYDGSVTQVYRAVGEFLTKVIQ